MSSQSYPFRTSFNGAGAKGSGKLRENSRSVSATTKLQWGRSERLRKTVRASGVGQSTISASMGPERKAPENPPLHPNITP